MIVNKIYRGVYAKMKVSKIVILAVLMMIMVASVVSANPFEGNWSSDPNNQGEFLSLELSLNDAGNIVGSFRARSGSRFDRGSGMKAFSTEDSNVYRISFSSGHGGRVKANMLLQEDGSMEWLIVSQQGEHYLPEHIMLYRQ